VSTVTVTVQCSPDADDLFMMRALLEGIIDTGRYRFKIDTAPTDALNRIASGDQAPDVSAISVAHYPAIAEHYQLLPHGGSMGEGYGPVVVAPRQMTLGELAHKRVAVPGTTTTAFSVLRMMAPEIQPVVVPIVPYHRIFDAIRSGDVDAGLVIHEGRLTFEREGCRLVADLGVWWAEQTDGLPLPLGANAIRRSLGADAIRDISGLLRASIAHGLADREAAIAWLLPRSALGTADEVGRYLDLYANQRTLDYGEAGRDGMRVYLERMVAGGWLNKMPPMDYAPV
jgi:1,4-dihydroxy-6-naphthoate synthase